MKKFLLIILLLCSSAFAQVPNPPTQLVINHGLPINCDSTVLFDWNDCAGATSYGLQIFSGSFTVLNVNGILLSEYTTTPNKFTPNTYYYCRINATGPGGTSQWSQLFNFSTPQPPPNPPNLLYPADSAEFISLAPVMDWSDVSGAMTYRIQISTSPMFNPVILNVNGLTNSGYSVQIGILSICTRYYWRVNATNNGGTSQWSQVRTFTTVCPSGVKQISTEIPSEYKLYNNYPNPFNPSTNIKYQITNNRFTTLKIFDILGREVKTLVNEFQKSGIYEVQFSLDGFESGVYFYRLQSGDFVDTKKLILLK